MLYKKNCDMSSDDEPVDGPTCYLVVTGFSLIDLLQQLSPVGLTAHVLMNINGGSAALTTGELSLSFWRTLLEIPSPSMSVTQTSQPSAAHTFLHRFW